MGKRASKLQPPPRPDTLPRQKAKQFYQAKDWKHLREKLRRKRRAQHEKIVMDVYRNNPEKTDPKDLQAFINSDMPLSELSLKKGKIKVASVLDHKRRIRDGGAKLAESNLQWLTKEEHNRKTGQEAHE